MSAESPPPAEKRARQRAQEILTRARAQAEQMRVRAQQQAAQIRARAATDAMRMREQTRQVGERAKVVADSAVQLIRINVPNTLTLFNGVCGFLSIIASVGHQYLLAAILILFGVFFDWFDGKAARAFGQETPLGKELDSLSDMVTFGVAPAVLVCVLSPSFFTYAAGGLFVLSAALRLGRFNIQQSKGVYFGFPTTTNGILLPALIFLGFPEIVFPYYLVLMALLMNAPIEIKKLF
jgi:CDP-diacylglycerol---serine O-phosphatidyltransferase